MFSLCAYKFKYSKEDFLQLTLPELDLLFDTEGKERTVFFNFLQNEFRSVNLHIYNSVAGKKGIRDPKKLYVLPFEEKERNKKLVEMAERQRNGIDPKLLERFENSLKN